jgi:hypothetical protein
VYRHSVYFIDCFDHPVPQNVPSWGGDPSTENNWIHWMFDTSTSAARFIALTNRCQCFNLYLFVPI